jgi:hypothetical protein
MVSNVGRPRSALEKRLAENHGWNFYPSHDHTKEIEGEVMVLKAIPHNPTEQRQQQQNHRRNTKQQKYSGSQEASSTSNEMDLSYGYRHRGWAAMTII